MMLWCVFVTIFFFLVLKGRNVKLKKKQIYLQQRMYVTGWKKATRQRVKECSSVKEEKRSSPILMNCSANRITGNILLICEEEF